jgi:hypothetical protein
VLEAIMGRLRSGDEGAWVSLYREFAADIGAVIAHIARSQGVRRLHDDDREALTIDACLALGRLAPGWDPAGGALPWRWARHRLVALVAAHLGRFGDPVDFDELEAEVQPPAWTGVEHDAVDTLAALADRNQQCALLADALGHAASRRDTEVLLRYAIQLRAGDPSPSHTVGAELGLRPPAVRQAARRARTRLASVVTRDPRYAQLAELALLDGVAKAA